MRVRKEGGCFSGGIECDPRAETIVFLGALGAPWGDAVQRLGPPQAGAGLPAVSPRPAATQEKPASSPLHLLTSRPRCLR